MNTSKRTVLAHMGYFDRSCRRLYNENSKEICKISSKKESIDIIELDIRKSQDGILYSYHGNIFEYYILLKVPQKFSRIVKRYQVDALGEVISCIDRGKTIFLDIKDTSITKSDILKIFTGKSFSEVIIGNKSFSYLSRFDNMPSDFVKIMNGNIFCNSYAKKKLKQSGYRYFEVVFPFQVTARSIQDAISNGLEFRVSGIGFFSKGHYFRKIEKYNINHISSDFI